MVINNSNNETFLLIIVSISKYVNIPHLLPIENPIEDHFEETIDSKDSFIKIVISSKNDNLTYEINTILSKL